MITESDTTDHKPFERLLHLGQAVTAYFDIQRTIPQVDKAYVVTDHGAVCSGGGLPWIRSDGEHMPRSIELG